MHQMREDIVKKAANLCVRTVDRKFIPQKDFFLVKFGLAGKLLGFVEDDESEKRAFVVFRGSKSFGDWLITDFQGYRTPFNVPDKEPEDIKPFMLCGKVHQGFYRAFSWLWYGDEPSSYFRKINRKNSFYRIALFVIVVLIVYYCLTSLQSLWQVGAWAFGVYIGLSAIISVLTEGFSYFSWERLRRFGITVVGLPVIILVLKFLYLSLWQQLPLSQAVHKLSSLSVWQALACGFFLYILLIAVERGTLEGIFKNKAITTQKPLNNFRERLKRCESVWFVGHSLGGAVAVLAFSLYETWCKKNNYSSNAHVITFGSPRMGDKEFLAAFEKNYQGKYLNVVHPDDPIPKLPPTSWRSRRPSKWYFSFGGWGLMISYILWWLYTRVLWSDQGDNGEWDTSDEKSWRMLDDKQKRYFSSHFMETYKALL